MTTWQDKTIQVEQMLNQMWLKVLSTSVNEGIGLKYINQGWHNQPYWYLWFKEKLGVYKLELVDVSALENYDWIADFKVKYYPHETEACFNGLSILEQACRTSNVFSAKVSHSCCDCSLHAADPGCHGDSFDLVNSTGAPEYSVASNIPEDFFYAGNISIALKTGVGSIVCSSSLSHWRVIMTDDYLVPNEHAGGKKLNKGEIDRNFPGFQLTECLYKFIISGWRAYHDYAVSRESISEQEGLVFMSDGYQLKSQPASDITRLDCRTELKYV